MNELEKARLTRQYHRLLRRWQTLPVDVSMAEVADALACTPRYARQLLQIMSTAGWLTWEGKVGRGAKGRLQCRLSEGNLSAIGKQNPINQQMVMSQVQKNETLTLDTIDQICISESDTAILVPYYFPLRPLVPSEHTTRTERHLISMVHAGLTRWCEELNHAVPDLAHSYMPLDNKQTWVFRLRGGLRWHSGEPVVSDQLLLSLLRHLDRPALSHVAQAKLVGPHTLVLRLNRPDALLPWRLANPVYGLSHPDGSETGLGPFQVEHHDDQSVMLTRAVKYHGSAPLLSRVNYCIESKLPPHWTEAIVTLQNHQTDPIPLERHDPQCSPGFVFLAFNENRKGLTWKQQCLIRALTKLAVEQMDSDWYVLQMPDGLTNPELPSACGENPLLPEVLTITYFRTPETGWIVERLQQSLRYRHCRLILKPVNSANWFLPGCWDEADMGISDLRLGKAWWYFSEMRFRHSIMIKKFMPEVTWSRIDNILNRSNRHITRYPGQIRRLMQVLLNAYWLQPLFSYRFHVHTHPRIQHVRISPHGLPDYCVMWVADMIQPENCGILDDARLKGE